MGSSVEQSPVPSSSPPSPPLSDSKRAAPFENLHTREYVGHKKKVHSVAWNCTGRKLASGSVDQTARIWLIEPHSHHATSIMMRGSLNKAKNKAYLEEGHTKKVGEDLALSQSQAPPNHGNHQGNTNMEGINMSWDSFDKAKRLKLKPMRGSLDADRSQEKLKLKVQEGNTNMDVVALPNMASLDKTKSNSTKGDFERLKLKPLRGNLKRAESQAKPTEEGEKSDTNMDGMAIPDMLRFLEREEALLTQLQSKMSAELSRLQVEEHVFLHTLKLLGQKHASTNKVKEYHQGTSSEDQDLIDALNEALMENGESVPSNQDIGEETSEE